MAKLSLSLMVQGFYFFSSALPLNRKGKNLEEEWKKTPVLVSSHALPFSPPLWGTDRRSGISVWLYLALQYTENLPSISSQKFSKRAVNHPLLQLNQWITTYLRILNCKTDKPTLVFLYHTQLFAQVSLQVDLHCIFGFSLLNDNLG